MRTLDVPSLGGLWEHAVVPLVNPMMWNPFAMADCPQSRLRAGNLHTGVC